MRAPWLLPLLAACAAAPQPAVLSPAILPAEVLANGSGPAIPDPAADTCTAAPHAGLIGQQATALERVLIMRQIRVLRPTDPVTGGFSPARLNIFIDPAGRIGRLICG